MNNLNLHDNELPLLRIDELELLPYSAVNFQSRDISNINAVDRAVHNNSNVYVGVFKNGSFGEYGIKCSFSRVVKLDSSRIKLMLEGLEKVRFTEIRKIDNVEYASADSVIEAEDYISKDEFEAYKQIIVDGINNIAELSNMKPVNYIMDSLCNASTLSEASYIAAMMLQDKKNGKYDILAENDPKAKFELVLSAIKHEELYYEVLSSVDEIVQSKINTQNKEYILREQRKAIDKQLGEDDGSDDLNELEKKIEELNADEEVLDKLRKEFKRLKRMPESAPEAAIVRSYLEWAVELPWNYVSESSNDIERVIEALNADHYGIENVKQRIAEYIAVRMLSKENVAGTSLCLVGPPGVGKTTIAKSIAKALNKDFAQLTLGGVHDEAEIRGHRRTYIGAMPGRVLSSLARCKSNNPVFLLDEVDKITKDMRGDPQAALLEVLDPNQNKLFRDNYLDIPYDLSNVMFVVTANDVGSIDKPLLDRMEIIKMDGYTPDEKLNIAKQYLVSKQAKANGLKDDIVTFEDAAITEIINGYTRESGVRELERKIAAVCRKIAFDKVKNGNLDDKISVTVNDVAKYLKNRIYKSENSSVIGEVGKVVGLAWNGYGGSALDIEAVAIPGSGEIKLTGNLGDIMKESAYIAVSLVRKRASKLGINEKFFKEHDIHIHVPEGAVPKDGPSAGITMATAILSAVTGKSINDNIAMTGEVSLTGKVLPIGGLKEKSLAASRLGISKVLIPRDNERDLEELPKMLCDSIEFIKMDSIDDVFREAVRGYGN